MNNADRYLSINRWLKKRYATSDGALYLYIGGLPTVYTRLDVAFWFKYIMHDEDEQ